MSFLWREIMNQVWAALFVLGVVFGAMVWIAMATWDGVRRFLRRIWGDGRG